MDIELAGRMMAEVDHALEEGERRVEAMKRASTYEEAVPGVYEVTLLMDGITSKVEAVIAMARAEDACDTRTRDFDAVDAFVRRVGQALERSTRILGGMAAVCTERGADMRSVTRRIGAARLLRVV